MTTIHWLTSPACQDVACVGGKAAHLSRLYATTARLGAPVPDGFCLPAAPHTRLTPAEARALALAYVRLGQHWNNPQLPVAVRSSAVDEDGGAASFAGQHESYLNVTGAAAVLAAAQKCRASAHQARVRAYRHQHGLPPASELAVLVQCLIPADVSFVAFSADPRTQARNRVVINAV